MKSSLTYPIQGLLCLVSVVLLALSASAAKAQVLLTVNISNPDQIVITATGNLLTVGSTSAGINEGFDLLGLFNTTTNFDEFIVNSTNLTVNSSDPVTGAGTLTLVDAEGDDVTGVSNTEPDLNLFRIPSTGQQMVFTNGQTAFTGSITIDLTQGLNLDGSIFSTGLTTANISTKGGSIELFDSKESIGSYVVITPEPQTWAALIAGMAFLGLLRRRLTRA